MWSASLCAFSWVGVICKHLPLTKTFVGHSCIFVDEFYWTIVSTLHTLFPGQQSRLLMFFNIITTGKLWILEFDGGFQWVSY